MSSLTEKLVIDSGLTLPPLTTGVIAGIKDYCTNFSEMTPLETGLSYGATAIGVETLLLVAGAVLLVAIDSNSYRK